MRFVSVPRPAGYSENNDCTVQALSNATGMPYENAYKIMQGVGRKHSTGLPLSLYKPVYDLFGKFHRLPLVRSSCSRNTVTGTISVKRFLSENPRGTFIVNIKGHVFCVKNGVILDTHKPGERQRVHFWWKIEWDGDRIISELAEMC